MGGVKGQNRSLIFGIREWDSRNSRAVVDREGRDGLYSGRGRSMGAIF